jgi:hypothetical protein
MGIEKNRIKYESFEMQENNGEEEYGNFRGY